PPLHLPTARGQMRALPPSLLLLPAAAGAESLPWKAYCPRYKTSLFGGELKQEQTVIARFDDEDACRLFIAYFEAYCTTDSPRPGINSCRMREKQPVCYCTDR